MRKIVLPETEDTRPNRWSSVWPTKEGMFWFFGYPWGRGTKDDDMPDVLCVQVMPVVNGCLYSTEGYMLRKSEGAIGLWTPVRLPAMPTLANTSRPK